MIVGLPPLKELLRYEVTTPVASYTFTAADIAAKLAALPFTPRHLVFDANARSDNGGVRDDLKLQLSGDAGNSYNIQYIFGLGGARGTAREDNQTSAGYLAITADGAAANTFGGGQVLFTDALSTRTDKAWLGQWGAIETMVGAGTGRRNNPADITSVTVLTRLAADFMAGTVFRLSVVDERYLVAGGEQILTADGTFSFPNLPQVPGYLSFIGNLRTAEAASISAIRMTVNGDAVNANYGRQILFGVNGGPPASATAADRLIGITAGAAAGADIFGPFVACMTQSALPDNYPHTLSLSGVHDVGVNGAVEHLGTSRKNQEGVHTVVFDGWAAGDDFLTNSAMWAYFTPKRLLERVTLEAAAASITFDNGGAGLSQGYHDLGVGLYGRTTS